MKWLFSIVLLVAANIICAQSQRAPIHDPPWLRGPTLQDRLVSHWRMDEASGTRMDSHWTNHLPAIPTVAQVTGKITNAIDFQGGYLELAPGPWISPSTSWGTSFTIAGWAQLDVVTGEQCFIAQYNAAGYAIQTLTTNLIFYVDGTGPLDSITATNILQTGTWYFFVVWHDSVADTINIQINNDTVASKSHTDGIVAPTQNFVMGDQGTSPRPMNGRLDSVSYWWRVLTPLERTALYNDGNGLDYPFRK